MKNIYNVSNKEVAATEFDNLVLTVNNPLNYDIDQNSPFYVYKIKHLSVALGMMPATAWNGKFDANVVIWSLRKMVRFYVTIFMTGIDLRIIFLQMLIWNVQARRAINMLQ